MIDTRFYRLCNPLSAKTIASELGASVVAGDPDRAVSGIAAAGRAGPSDLCFLEQAAGAGGQPLAAGIVLTAAGVIPVVEQTTAVIVTDRPRAGFARIAQQLIQLKSLEPGQSAIHPSARLDPSVRLEPGVVIGPQANLGRGVQVGANAVIGPGCQIGADTFVGATASIRCALIGDGVRIFPGAVIGEAGFGLAAGASGASLTPHFGRVILQNGVSVGANSCVDRGLLEDTIIGEGSHIDNLCHIAHNCLIGSHVVMAAFAGVSGSSRVGDGVQFGGRVGLKDHVVIGAGARIAAGAAVLSDVPAGETWAGYPARPIRRWMRELAWLARSAQKRSSSHE